MKVGGAARRAVLVAWVPAALLAWLVGLASPAAAAAACAQVQQTVSCTFSYTGAEQSLVVPVGVRSVVIEAVGAPGGGSAGGTGGTASATVPVTPGSTLYVEVGGAGTTSAGGFNGGGAPGTPVGSGVGGGGGASDVRTALGSRLVVAAGGGGSGALGLNAGAIAGGGAAGAAGATGRDSSTDTGGGGGGAGTASAGGAFGMHGSGDTDGADGTAGAFGVGGAGASAVGGATTTGGGGGGGYWGGGGGGGGGASTGHQGGGGGGGGGSCYALAATTCGMALGGPEVVISYVPDRTAPAISVATPVSGAVYPRGAAVLASYSCADEAGGSGLAGCHGSVARGSAIDTGAPGPHAFTVSASDNAGNTASRTVDYTVAAAPSISIVSPWRGHKYKPGQRVRASYKCHEGAYGPGIKSCTGTVRRGALIDTMSLKKVKFTVTAISRDGQKTSKTVTYSVVAPKVVSAPQILVSTGDLQQGWAFSRLVSMSGLNVTCPRPLAQLQCPKSKQPPSVILGAPLTDDTSLWNWHLEAVNHDPKARKTIELTVYTPGGKKAAVYRLTNAWPTKVSVQTFRAGGTKSSTVTVTFTGESLTRVG